MSKTPFPKFTDLERIMTDYLGVGVGCWWGRGRECIITAWCFFPPTILLARCLVSTNYFPYIYFKLLVKVDLLVPLYLEFFISCLLFVLFLLWDNIRIQKCINHECPAE